MRLAKYLAHCGVDSRRGAEKLIAHGVVTVGGERVTDPARDVPRLVEHVAAGRIDLGALVTARIGLDGVNDALDAMRAGQGARTLVVPGT